MGNFLLLRRFFGIFDSFQWLKGLEVSGLCIIIVNFNNKQQKSSSRPMQHTLILLLVFLLPKVSPLCTVTLQTHKQCPSSQELTKIITKLQEHETKNPDPYPIVYKIEEYEGEEGEGKDGRGRVYPTIWIDDGDTRKSYENQAMLVELEYWLALQCRHRIPVCGSWMNQPIFPINIPPPAPTYPQRQAYTNFLAFLVEKPVIKICQDPSLAASKPSTPSTPIYTELQNTITQLLHSLPLFSKFTHNVRNYLLGKAGHTTAVIYVAGSGKDAGDGLKGQFVEVINYIRRRDRRISYHIGDQARDRLIFLQEKAGSKIVDKLIAFLGLDVQRIREQGAVIAFRFVQSKNSPNSKILQGLQYKFQGPNKVLDNKFIFWLEQIALSTGSPKIHQKLFPSMPPLCHTSSITHTCCPSNLTSQLQNIKLLKLLKDSSGQEEEKEEYGRMIFNRVLFIEDEGQNKDEDYKEAVSRRVTRILEAQEVGVGVLRGMEYEEVDSLYIDGPSIRLCYDQQEPQQFWSYQQLLSYLHKTEPHPHPHPLLEQL